MGHPGSRSAQLHVSGRTATLAGPPRERARFQALRLLGLVGTMLIALGAVGGGALPVVENPWFRGPLGALMSPMMIASSSLVLVGTGCLVAAWLCMAPFVGASAGPPRIDAPVVLRTFIAWVLPLMATAPLFTQDIYSYLANGSIVRQGLDPYSAGPVELLGVDHHLARSVPFIWAHSPSPYGPVALGIAGAISSLTGDSIFWGVLDHRVVSVAGILAAAWGIAALARRCGVAVPAALWLDPVRFNFYYGSLTVFTVALVATDLWWKRPERAAEWLPAGLLTGLAAAITLRPLIFAVYFLLRKDTKAAAWMAGGFAVPTLIAAAARPEMSWRYFTDYLFHLDSRVALDQAQNLSLTGAVKRFAPEASQQVLWLVLAAAVAAALVWAAKAFVAAGEDAMAYVCLALVPLLCGPVSLPYSWAWMLPALVVVFEFAVRTRDEWMLLVGLLYLAFTTVFVPHSQFKNMDRIVDRDRVLGDWVMSSVVWGYRQTEREPRRHANRPIARPNQTLESA